MIKMTLEHEFNIIMNLKKIRRLMKKFNLICPIRKANPMKRIARAIRTSHVAPNKLERKFKEGLPGEILLTDISYMTYDMNKRVYFSTIKDSVTNEIYAWSLSESLDMKFVVDTINHLDNVELHPNVYIHSDQGSHYTSIIFQELLKKMEIEQSMSRRGNCWDNAPMESYFGHMKDEVSLIDCKTLEEATNEIRDYIDYYNNYRYQWNLNRMTPKKYGDSLRSKNKNVYKKDDYSTEQSSLINNT